jgi:putative oxidoreductase
MTAATKTTVLVLRLALGAVLLAHGMLKLGLLRGGQEEIDAALHAGSRFADPELFRVAVTAIEAGGGLLLILGLLGRVAALAVVALMAFRVAVVHSPYFFVKDNGFEFPLVLGAIAFSLLLLGMGPVSLDGVFDNWRRSRREQRGGSAGTGPGDPTGPFG